MKNKLYYMLPVLYISVFAFILYVNGVFTGDINSVSNLIINVGFLVVIGILLLISCISFSRLNEATDDLVSVSNEMNNRREAFQKNLWSEYRQKKDVFSNLLLNQQFEKYQRRIAVHTTSKGTVTEGCPIEEYINEDLLDQIGHTYFNSAISGTMTGLGILGTFLGLSLGMSSFSGNDIFAVSDNIAPLLDGMKVAFHTSVYGIFFSLVFTLVYRSLMSDAYEKLSFFLSSFRECAAPVVSPVDEDLSTMLIYQANMANSLKTMMDLMKGNAEEQIKGVDKIVQLFTYRMSDMLGNDLEKLGRNLSHACEAQSIYASNFQRLEESTRQLLEASRIMNETMNLTLKKEREIEKTLSGLSEDLSSELYAFSRMRNMYEKQ